MIIVLIKHGKVKLFVDLIFMPYRILFEKLFYPMFHVKKWINVLQIEGDVLAVKKALVAVSRRLQDCPNVDKTKLIGGRPLEVVPQQSLPDPRVDLFQQRGSVLPPIPSNTISYASGSRPLSINTERISTLDPKTSQQEVIFKILCSNDRVGGVIGKGGTIVKALQNEAGASISVGAPVAECDERLITITASEVSQCSDHFSLFYLCGSLLM